MAQLPSGASPRTPLSRIADFDDQFWPVNLGVIVLGALVAGIVYVTTDDFFDPRLIYNGLFRLAVVAVLLGVSLWAMTLLRGRVRRRVQLCVVLSLILHLGLALYLRDQVLSFIHPAENRAQGIAQETQQNPQPDYYYEHVDQPQAPQSFERPVQTAAPVPAELEPVAEPEPPAEKPLPQPAPVEAEEPPPSVPERANLRRAEPSAPHREEVAAGGQISRQEWKYRPQPGEPIPQPEVRPARRQSPPALAPQVAEPERRQTPVPQDQQQVLDPEPSAEQAQEAMRLARRATEPRPEIDRPTTPAPTRQIAPVADMPRTEAEALQPVPVAPPAQAVALQPAAAPTRRQQAMPRSVQLAGEPAAGPAPIAVAAVPARRPEDRPALSQSPAGRPSRQALAPGAPSAQAAPLAPVAAGAGQPTENLQPAGAQVARQIAGAASPGPLGTPAEAADPGAAAMGSRAVLRRLAGDNPAAGLGQSPGAQLARHAAPVQGIFPAQIAQPMASGAPADAEPAPAPAEPRGAGVTRAAVTPRLLAGAADGLGGAGDAIAGTSPLPAAIGRSGLRQAAGSDEPSLAPTATGAPIARSAYRSPMPSGDRPELAGIPVEEAAPGGTASGSAQGALAGPLELGPDTAVQPAAADAPVGSAATAPGTAGLGLGSDQLVAVAAAGRRAAVSDGPPVLAAASGAGTLPLGRTPATVQPSISAQPAMETPGGGPAGVAAGAGAGGEPAGPLQPAGTEVAMVGPGQEGLPQGQLVVGEGAGEGTGQSALGPARVGRAARPEPDAGGTPGGSGAGPIARTPSPAPTLGIVGGEPAPEPLAGGEGGEPAGEMPAQIGPRTEAAGGAPGGGNGPGEGGSPLAVDAPAAGGLPGELVSRLPVDTAAAPGPAASLPGLVAGPRRLPPGDEEGPTIAAQVGSAPMRKATAPGLPTGLIESAQPAAGTAVAAEPSAAEVSTGTDVGEPARQEGGFPVLIPAPPGPGGLSSHPLPVLGVPSRLARPESDAVTPAAGRFVVARTGGRPSIDGHALQSPAEGFRQREPGGRGQRAAALGGSPETEQAVEAGLDFLARSQFPDGHWSLNALPDAALNASPEAALGQMHGDTAATGLALLAFLGAGYTHTDEKHRFVVREGLQWLVRNQQPDGQLFTEASDGTKYARFYGHAIATIALCEAYGMTRDPDLREPARKAIQFVLDAQNPERGGWRYEAQKESDTSVSGWQLMALKSAQMADLEVPAGSLAKVSQWLDKAQADGGARYMYNPYAGGTPSQILGREPNRAMTAEGLLMRMYLGWQRDNPALLRGADYLKANLPSNGTAQQPLRDSYYWYYATQVMFHFQGDHWKAWNDRLRAMLQESQVRKGSFAGSWDPAQPVPDRWSHAAGRHYVTSLNLLMLEVYYRHLPLYQTLAP